MFLPNSKNTQTFYNCSYLCFQGGKVAILLMLPPENVSINRMCFTLCYELLNNVGVRSKLLLT